MSTTSVSKVHISKMLFYTLFLGFTMAMTLGSVGIGKVGHWFHKIVSGMFHIHTVNRYSVTSDGNRTINPLFETILILIDRMVNTEHDTIIGYHNIYMAELQKKVDRTTRGIIKKFISLRNELNSEEEMLLDNEMSLLEKVRDGLDVNSKRKAWDEIKDDEDVDEETKEKIRKEFVDEVRNLSSINKVIRVKRELDKHRETISEAIHKLNFKKSINTNEVELNGVRLKLVAPYSMINVKFDVPEERRKKLKLWSKSISFRIYTVGDIGDGIPTSIELWIPKRGREIISDVNQLLVLFAVECKISCPDTVNLVNSFRIDDVDLVKDTYGAIINHTQEVVGVKVHNIIQSSDPDRLGSKLLEMKDGGDAKLLAGITTKEFQLALPNNNFTDCAMNIAKTYYDQIVKDRKIETVKDLQEITNEMRALYGPKNSVYVNAIVYANNMPLFLNMLIEQDAEFKVSMRQALTLRTSMSGILQIQEFKIKKFFINSMKKMQHYPLIPEYMMCIYLKMLIHKKTPRDVSSKQALGDFVAETIGGTPLITDTPPATVEPEDTDN